MTVTVADACTQLFEYTLSGIPRETERSRSGGLPISRSAVYDPQYGVYVFAIDRAKNPSPDQKDAEVCTGLEPATLVIQVEDGGTFEIGQDAALTYTLGTSDQYFVESSTQKVKVDPSRNEAGRFNFATLTHLYWRGKVGWGPVLGFGVTGNSDFEYYLGGSLGFGPRNRRVLNVAAGAVSTKANVLPAGLTEGGGIGSADPESLKSLPTKRTWRLFVALTATFFRTGEQKPAAPSQ